MNTKSKEKLGVIKLRLIGTQGIGIRTPIISKGDNLEQIAAICLKETIDKQGITLCENDIVGITEGVVAKAQGNYASIDDIAIDIKNKFNDDEVGLVFPMTSRNRFFNILKGISKGAKKVYVLLNYPTDDVGNPIIDPNNILHDIKFPISGDEFIKLTNGYKHPFTDVCYISLFKEAGANIEIYISNKAEDILKFTKNILVAEVHAREITKQKLIKAGANKVYTLADILNEPINNSGYNEDYGVLGSNLATDDTLKLFPRDCNNFVNRLQKEIKILTNVEIEILIFADGAFKDPAYGIWELADPTVSPGYTKRLGESPNEIKLKYIADNVVGHLSNDEKEKEIKKMIKEKKVHQELTVGTTPRKYADLIGSLCDLLSGSGDKGTPMVLIKGYFDDYTTQ